jgi:hypothetical protein
MAVEPLTSQKSIVTTRRSPTMPPLACAASSLDLTSRGMYWRRSDPAATGRGGAGPSSGLPVDDAVSGAAGEPNGA